MKSSKRQSLIVIGFGLIILSGVILYFALSMPRISVSNAENTYEYSYSQAVDNSYTYNIERDNITSDSNVVSNNSGSSVSYPLNLNTCTAEELMSIDGIGEKKASDIIEYRDYLGGYTSVEQIKNIKGIGDGVYEKLSPYLIV
ncbi:MAG: helix-hairpin-helix domain-containing protein [Eubacterium sp.]|nr:helix-hairpin-helix domain-containing protein [Eubacterium sp.]MDE6155371.1 helix-hairpin-helix domain-containing protein [Eubacterium sp.]